MCWSMVVMVVFFNVLVSDVVMVVFVFAGGHICPRPGSPSHPSGRTLVLCCHQLWQETDPVLRLITGLQCPVSGHTQVLLRTY